MCIRDSSRPTLQRQSSIADNNGSPVKNSPNEENNPDSMQLAELPLDKNVARVQNDLLSEIDNRRSRVEDNNLSHLFKPITQENRDDNDKTEDTDNNIKHTSKNAVEKQSNITPSFIGDEERELLTNESEVGSTLPPTDKHQNRNGQITPSEETDDEDEANTTVRINPPGRGDKNSTNVSLQKVDVLKIFEGESLKIPSWLKGSKSKSQRRKPYTTVLYKDIDNSKPDPRNILPERTPRSAAKRAAQLLSGSQLARNQSKEGEEEQEESNEEVFDNSEQEEFSSDEDSSSGIETADSEEMERVMITENNKVKVIKAHALKEAVVPKLVTSSGAFSRSSGDMIEHVKELQMSAGVTENNKIEQDKIQELTKLPSSSEKLKNLKAKFSKQKPNSFSLIGPSSINDDSFTVSINEESDSLNETTSDSSSEVDEEVNFKNSKNNVADVSRAHGDKKQNSSGKIVSDGGRMQQSDNVTPGKVPLTELLSSPISNKPTPTKVNTMLHNGLPPKVRPSLNSLSDLIYKGIPDVKEKRLNASQPNFISKVKNVELNETDETDDNLTSSDSDSSSSDSTLDNKGEEHSLDPISTKTQLGKKKKKRSSGFASLIRESKQK